MEYNTRRFARVELLALDPFEKPTLRNTISTLCLNTISGSLSVLSQTLDRTNLTELTLAGLVLFGGAKLIDRFHQIQVPNQNMPSLPLNHEYQENDYLIPLNILPIPIQSGPTALPTPEPTPIPQPTLVPTPLPTTSPRVQPTAARINLSQIPVQEAKTNYIPETFTGYATIYYRAGCVGCSDDRRMANGQPLIDSNATIATKLPFALNEVVVITNLRTGTQAMVTVTDRGGNEIVDLTPGSANLIGWKPGDKIEISSIPR